MEGIATAVSVALVLGGVVQIKSVRVILEYQRCVLFRLGRVDPGNLKVRGCA